MIDLFGIGVKTAQREGDAARERRDWIVAAAAYRRVLAVRPERFGIQVQLGHMLKEAGDLSGARAAYAAALALKPDDADLLRWYGILDMRQGDHEAAIEKLKRSVTLGEGRANADLEEARTATRAKPSRVSGGNGTSTQSAVRVTGRVVGHVDGADGNLISGWAIDPDHRGQPAELAFYVDDHQVCTGLASLPRNDLGESGAFAFRVQLDLSGFDGSVWVSVRLKRTNEELLDSPVLANHEMRNAAPFASDARFTVVKPLAVGSGQELALFVTHSRTGAIKPHVLSNIRVLASEGVAVLLIVVADRPATVEPELLDLTAGAVVRENWGYDFACWAHMLQVYPEAYAAPVLYLINDSVFGPPDRRRLAAVLGRVRSSEADVVGLTESHDFGWHVQTYFVALKRRALSNLHLHLFFNDVRMLDDKHAVIRSYESRLAATMEDSGNSVEVLFLSHAVRNPTLFGWRELLDDGFPFVKLLLLRGEFPTVDISDWRTVLARHGFDMMLLDRTLAAGMEGWSPLKPGFPLLARPNRNKRDKEGGEFMEPRQGPLKVAFFGPWNYDNGLGAASRGLIAALRRCGVLLNIHPVKVPFHIHTAIVPPVDVTDFVGPADIAVVHLNPDSWMLLTEAQRTAIWAAKRRIGHWVWEMDHIPPAWQHNLASVDRVWAPSQYCAALFARDGTAPVDVVPYTVPLAGPGLLPEAREQLMAKLGLQPGHRVILYAFDGSSYLVRKNPGALVRAFKASGLAARGWTLVLKTKHLFDRPKEGRQLEQLVAGSPGVTLINAALSHDEMAGVAALCDVYASPHCSEGFGLTVAEAMAAGKPVVVTEYGGTTQFVDASCGYPVRADLWTLEEDFGHYTKGGTWGRIDETALADTLRQAAASVERGDTTIPDAARRRVAEMLSYEAVGQLIAASLDETMEKVPFSSHRASPLPATPQLGSTMLKSVLGELLIPVPLQPDLSPPTAPELGRVPNDRDHWVVFAPEQALLAPLFRQVVTSHANLRPDVAVFYADDVALGEDTYMRQLRLKPEFDPALLAAQDYVGAPVIVRASALHQLGGLDRAAGPAALSDLLFRADALGMSIARIPSVLLAWKGRRPEMPRDIRRQMLERLPNLKPFEVADGLLPGTLQLQRRFGTADAPEVTLVIPTRRTTIDEDAGGDGTATYVERLLDALARTDWPNNRLHVLVGDDVVGTPGWEARRWPFRLTRLETPRAEDEPFNYAAKMNRLWRASHTEHLVLLNDDVLPRDGTWLRALLTFSADEAVGGVGARLLYPDGTVQHAGMMPLLGTAVHGWAGLPASRGGYGDWPLVHRGWSMVTGAVFATRRSLMEQVNGFDERFTLDYNDVDLCLRLRALGYRIVYTPHAELWHTEMASRGKRPSPGMDTALFLERWRDWLANDPSFHPMLRGDKTDIEPAVERGPWYG